MKRSLCLWAWVVFACQGCSFAFVRPAPKPPVADAGIVDCTSSPLLPLLDGLGAAQLGGVLFVTSDAFAVHGPRRHEVSNETRALRVTALALAVVEVASSAYGFTVMAECRREKQRSYQTFKAVPAQPLGCTGDAECKAGRRCEAGRCTWSRPPTVKEP